MANETKEIGDIVKKCKILLLDIEGTTTSISFVKDKLFPYAEEHVKEYLEKEWEAEDAKEAVAALRKLALEDQENKVDGVVTIPGEDASKEDQIEGLVSSVKWQMSSDRKVGALKQLQGLIWKQGYDKGDIKGHVYDDVAAALDLWRSTEGHKVYIYSSGSVQAQKLLFGQSLAGDLLPRIDGHFDTAVGGKQEAPSYTAIAEKIGVKPDEVLFLTDIVKEAETARAAGMEAALVSREGNAPLPAEATAAFPVLHSLAQLSSNKRKQDQVEEEVPAKVAKTEPEAATSATNGNKETEKMEVEETKKEEEPVQVVTVIEEITDSNEPVDAPMCDIEPIVEEDPKTDEKETEKVAEAKTGNEESDSKPKEDEKVKNGDAPVTPPTIIEEVTNDKDSLEDVVDINDLQPVVEEPAAAEDMEVLQNVGEVLEKECDEILSKVQDVTNLENIPVKPLLNSIAEETMETENLDSNDIVDGILDTELELEMKQTENGLSSNGEAKTETKEENGIMEDTPSKELNNANEKTADTNEESKINDDGKSNEVSTETKVDEKTVKKVEDKKETETPVVTESKDPPVDTNSAPKTTTESVNSEEEKPIDSKTEVGTEESKPAEEKAVEASTPVLDVKPAEESKTETKAETVKPEETTEPQMNGKATNGDSAPTMNGDANKDDELSSRLSVENGKEVVNGSNGTMETEGQGDKVEEVADIKVKTIAAAEPLTDPIEQPTEA